MCTGQDAMDPPLSPSDIKVDSRTNPQLITVHLYHSKMDPFGVGCTIYLGHINTTLVPWLLSSATLVYALLLGHSSSSRMAHC